MPATARAADRPPRHARPNGLKLVLLLGLAACLGYLATEAYLLSLDFGFPLDDSWIHLQFARNLAGGNGLSYDGERLVSGSTAPLWTALLSLAFLLPGGPILWIKGLGTVLYLAGVDATYRLARELGLAHGLSLLAAALTAGSGWLVWSALSGMEVPLFILLGLWGMILHLRERRDARRPVLSLPVLGLAVLARPEGALLLLLAVFDRLLVLDWGEAGPRWRPPPLSRLAGGLALAALVLVPVLLFYLWIGDSFLPTTYAAKTTGVRRWLPSADYVYTIAGIFFRSQPYMVLLAGAGMLVLLRRVGGERDRGLLPALWLAGLPLAYSTISPLGQAVIAGNFGRYLFPLFPVLVVLGVLGLESAASGLERRPANARWRRAARAAAIALLVWPTASTLVRGAARYAQTVANVQDSDVRMARWLAERLPPEAVVAVNDIGALKYFLPNPILDLAGIVNPEVRREARAAAGGRQEGIGRFLERHRPDYLVVFPSWFPQLGEEGSPFRPVYGLEIPDNITMGGDRLVVFTTPWNRYPLRTDPAGEAGAEVSR